MSIDEVGQGKKQHLKTATLGEEEKSNEKQNYGKSGCGQDDTTFLNSNIDHK